MIHWLLAGIILLATTTVALAELDSDAKLEALINRIETLQADFSQTVFDEHGRPVESAFGRFSLRRPSEFLWHYQSPHEQIIVSDGAKLWLYDKELEQVTVRSIDESLSAGPMAILANQQPLAASFSIDDFGIENHLHWFVLTPKSEDDQTTSQFSTMRLAFDPDSDRLRQLELIDVFGRRTAMRLLDMLENPVLNDTLFQFSPPPGVDVIDAAGTPLPAND